MRIMMERPISLLLVPVLVGALASACGTPFRPASFQPEGATLRMADDTAAALVSAFRRAYEDLDTLSGRVTRKERDPSSGETRTTVVSFEAELRKGWIRGLIEESVEPGARGARFVFLNDGKVKVRVKIGFLPVTRTFSIDDDNVTSIRKYRIDQTDFNAMSRIVLAPGAMVRSQGPAEILGRKVDLLRIMPAGLPDASHEEVGLDPESHLPVARRAFGPIGPERARLPVMPGWPGLDGEQEILSVLLEGETRNPELDPAGWEL